MNIYVFSGDFEFVFLMNNWPGCYTGAVPLSNKQSEDGDHLDMLTRDPEKDEKLSLRTLIIFLIVVSL